MSSAGHFNYVFEIFIALRVMNCTLYSSVVPLVIRESLQAPYIPLLRVVTIN